MIVSIVDDDVSLIKALTMLFESEGYQVNSFTSADAFFHQVEHLKLSSGCLILDLRMPGMSGAELYLKLKAQLSHWAVIFLTGHGKVTTAVEMMKNGAFEFLQKPVDYNVLLDTVKKGLAISELKTRKSQLTIQLTGREVEILELMNTGFSSKEMAGDLNISTKTVEFHRTKIRDKVNLRQYRKILVALKQVLGD